MTPARVYTMPKGEEMKRGDKVAVCYDGKWSRRTQGVVLATKQTGRILVRFKPYAEAEEVEKWFPRRARQHYWGGKPFYYAGHVADTTSIGYRLYGWIGDWYSVFPWGGA